MTPYRQPVPRPSVSGLDEYEVAIRRAAFRRKVVTFGATAVFFLSPFGYIGWKLFEQHRAEVVAHEAELLDAAEQKEMDDLLAKADAALDTQEAKWKAATTPAALAAVKESDDDCSSAPSAPDAQSADSYIKYGSIDMSYFGNADYTLIKGGNASEADPVSYPRRRLADVRAKSSKKEATKDDLDTARSIVLGTGGRAIFVDVSDETEPDVSFGPDVDGDGTFDPGSLHGRAYLYRVDEGRIVCAGDLEAESSPTVDVRYFTTTINGSPITDTFARHEGEKAGVQRDFQVQIRRALATGLRAVP